VKIDGYEPVIFKKVVHDWGGKYYFRNGLSITDLQFELLTSTENDFAPSFDERKQLLKNLLSHLFGIYYDSSLCLA